MEKFTFKNGKSVTLKNEYVGFYNKDNWKADEWKSTIKYQGKQYTVSFKMGVGHQGKEPSIKDVICSLVLDSNGVYGKTFEEWASDYGYDTDSRKAEQTHKECLKIWQSMKRLFDSEEYKELEEMASNY